MKLHLITRLVLVVTLAVGGGAQFLPFFQWVRSFFGEYEQPAYTIIRNITQDVEERTYAPVQLVCNEKFFKSGVKDSKTSEMFMTLLRYIQGSNEQNQKIDMTVPVTTKVDHRNGDLWSYEMCFFLPAENQASPPKPTNSKEIRIIKFPQLHLYSKRYGGYSSESVEKEQLASLKELLQNQSVKYFEHNQGDRATYFIAVYDSPTKFWDRRNEVWLLAADTPKNFNNRHHTLDLEVDFGTQDVPVYTP